MTKVDEKKGAIKFHGRVYPIYNPSYTRGRVYWWVRKSNLFTLETDLYHLPQFDYYREEFLNGTENAECLTGIDTRITIHRGDYIFILRRGPSGPSFVKLNRDLMIKVPVSVRIPNRWCTNDSYRW